ncbi:MAG: hypothetical protein CSA36_05780 [Draconibacterium sp.]|nr:MAG: hypothetical protein CSA36_05780 [Draconibacterium sp.]
MGNLFKKILRQYLEYPRADRNVIIVLVAMILITIFVNELVKCLPEKPDEDYSTLLEKLKIWEETEQNREAARTTFSPFDPNTISEEELNSLSIPRQVARNIIKYRNTGAIFSKPSDLRRIYGMDDSIFSRIEPYLQFPSQKAIYPKKKETLPAEMEHIGSFDPNIATAERLKLFGFNSFQTDNIIRYREKGGQFKLKQDLLKIYGVDTPFFEKLAPHIKIQPTKNSAQVKEEKLDFVTIDLNSADTSQLKKLPGIGPVFATRIVKYRILLGGFSKPSQLLEVYGFPPETYYAIENQITTDTTNISRIRINFADYAELIRHPYFNQEMVKAMIKYRDNNGIIQQLNELEEIKGFDKQTIEKIRPYITCR